jgi:hypothetical protein
MIPFSTLAKIKAQPLTKKKEQKKQDGKSTSNHETTMRQRA